MANRDVHSDPYSKVYRNENKCKDYKKYYIKGNPAVNKIAGDVGEIKHRKMYSEGFWNRPALDGVENTCSCMDKCKKIC